MISAGAALYDLLDPSYDTDHPEGFRPRISYAICSTPRSGSTLLADGLARIAGCGTPLEYFGPLLFRQTLLRRWQCDYSLDYLEQLARRRTDRGGVFGMKLHWSQLREYFAQVLAPGEWYAEAHAKLGLHFPGLKYIFITRINHVQQAVSHWRAARTGRYASFDPPNADDRVYLDYDFDEIHAFQIEHSTQEADWWSYFKANGIAPLTLTYEDLRQAYDAQMQVVFRFLGCTPPDGELAVPRLEQQADGLTAEITKRYRADLESRRITPERAEKIRAGVRQERVALLVQRTREARARR